MADRKGYEARKAAEETKRELVEITERLEKGVAEVFNDGKYQEFYIDEYIRNLNFAICITRRTYEDE